MLANGAEIVTYMKPTGRLNAGENSQINLLIPKPKT
jgi:hypothetical protein